MTIDTQIEAARAEVDKVQLCAVSFHLNEASHNATAAYWADDCRDFLAAKMLDGIKKALGELGFDIVERTPSADADQLPEAAEFKPSLELIDKCADAVKAELLNCVNHRQLKQAASESIYAATGSISDPTPAPGVKPKAF